MKTVLKIGLIVCLLSLSAVFLTNYAGVEYGTTDFFTKHGFFFLISIAFFPRLTLLVSGLLYNSIVFGDLFWWLGFFFCPRILVACLATISYWQTNPILVIASWFIAMGGESSEKVVIRRTYQKYRPQEREVRPTYDIEAEAKRIE